MRRFICWIPLFMLVAIPVAAQDSPGLITVEDLRDTCRSVLELKEQLALGDVGDQPAEIVRTLRCVSFIEGVVAAVVRLGAAGFMVDPLHETSFCFPDGTSSTDWVGEFVKWVDSNPDKAQMSSVDGLLLSLIETYPCEVTEESGG